MTVIYALYGVAALLALAPIAIALGGSPRGSGVVYGASLIVTLTLGVIALLSLFEYSDRVLRRHAAARPALARRAFPHRRAGGILPGRGQSRRRGGEPVRARLWPARAFTATRAAVLSRLSRRHESGGDGGRCVQLPGVVGIHVAHLLGAGDRASSGTREPARRLHLSADGELRHAGAAARFRPARRRRRQLRVRRHPRVASVRRARGAGADPGAGRRRLEGGRGAVACLAAARPSRRAQPRLRADERRDDQGRGLRFRAHRVRPARHCPTGGGAWSCSPSAASPR